ncbi:MAG: hypothetical protein DI589_11995 [Shinella sp.]|nr:MAG: hypothetical protein DI589_11995 [Shinella sp.]
MIWVVFLIATGGLYAFIWMRPDSENPGIGALAYLVLIALSIAFAFVATDGKGIRDDGYSQCGSGPIKYDC